MKNGRAPHLSQKKSERRAGGPPNSLAMDVMVNLQKDMKRIKFREGVWRMSPKKLDMITRGLSKSEPFGGQGSCFMASDGRSKCQVNPEHDCRVSRSIYKTTCLTCQEGGIKTQYVGTTGRSTHAHQMDHKKEVIARSASNALSKHHRSKHPDLTRSFQTDVLGEGSSIMLTGSFMRALKLNS